MNHFQKTIDDSTSSDDTLAIIVAILVLLPFLIIFGSVARQEAQLHQRLLQEGESAVATVQACEKERRSKGGFSCYIEYEYEVKLANGQVQKYTTRELVSCKRECNIGSSLNISYLPREPAKSSLEGRGPSNSATTMFIFSLIYLFALLSKLPWGLLMKKLHPTRA